MLPCHAVGTDSIGFLWPAENEADEDSDDDDEDAVDSRNYDITRLGVCFWSCPRVSQLTPLPNRLPSRGSIPRQFVNLITLVALALPIKHITLIFHV